MGEMLQDVPTYKLLDEAAARVARSEIKIEDAAKEFRKRCLLAALYAENYRQIHAAKRIGIHRNTFSRSCAEFGIDLRKLRIEARATIKKQPRGIRADGEENGGNRFIG